MEVTVVAAAPEATAAAARGAVEAREVDAQEAMWVAWTEAMGGRARAAAAMEAS